jgi:hypothetical protein
MSEDIVSRASNGTPPSLGREPAPAANRALTIPDFELGDRLTTEQLDFLETFGFIRFKAFKSRPAVRELALEVEEIDARLVAERRTSIFGVPLMLGKREDGSRYVQRIPFASIFGPRLHAFLEDRRFGGILAAAGPGYRIGERERDGLVVNQFRREAGSAYTQLGWHTDSLRDLFYGERPRRYLNVGFYLDDSPIEKGGVRVIPFSHQQGLWPMITRKVYFIDNDPDPAEYAITAEAGDLTIHDGRIWHRVAKASVVGEESRRRVMYVPLMEGPLRPKNDSSPTPLYFRLRRFARF